MADFPKNAPDRKEAATLGSSLYEQLRHDIVFGLLRPDTKLKLDSLKNLYQASVPTLRETLNRLASEGFVSAPAQRGFFVAPVSSADLTEIAQLRILLETHALRISIQNGDTNWEADLLAAYHRLRQSEKQMLGGDHSVKELWKYYDWKFHQLLIRNCQSANLLALHGLIFDKYLRYQMLVLTFRGSPAAVEHNELFEAAMSRDAENACAMLTRHIEDGLAHALPSFEQAAQ